MAALEKPFVDAIEAKEIEGALLFGKDVTGKSYTKILGTRTLLDGTTQPLASDNIVFLASATKLLSAIAALQCVERGQLSLDGDLASLLPELVSRGVLTGYSDSGSPIIEPLKKALTLRHLLTHSGVAYNFFDPNLKRWAEENPPPKPNTDVPTRFNYPLQFQPGEGWMYGPGLDWAGHLIEKVSGMRLDEYFRTHLLAPLGATATDIAFFPVAEGLGDRMPDVNPKDPKGLGLSGAMGNDPHEGVTACCGGQCGYASGTAYIAVLHSILANDEKLLSKQTVEQMFKPQLEPGARKALDALLSGPMSASFAMNSSGKDRSYGIGGLLIGEDGDCGMGRGTLTWGGGINNTWFIDPKNGVCGFASPQLGLPSDAEKAMALKSAFKKELANALKAM